MTPLSRVSANFPIFGCHSLCSFGGLPALRKQFHDNDHVWGHGVREQGMFITVILLLCSNNNNNKHNWWCAEDHHRQRQHHRHQYVFEDAWMQQRKISINRLHIKSKIHMLSVWSWGCCCRCCVCCYKSPLWRWVFISANEAPHLSMMWGNQPWLMLVVAV